jgi:hypothetical protein
MRVFSVEYQPQVWKYKKYDLTKSVRNDKN